MELTAISQEEIKEVKRLNKLAKNSRIEQVKQLELEIMDLESKQDDFQRLITSKKDEITRLVVKQKNMDKLINQLTK